VLDLAIFLVMQSFRQGLILFVELLTEFHSEFAIVFLLLVQFLTQLQSILSVSFFLAVTIVTNVCLVTTNSVSSIRNVSKRLNIVNVVIVTCIFRFNRVFLLILSYEFEPLVNWRDQ